MELYYGSPKEAGLNESRLGDVDRLMKRCVGDAFPGGVLLIARKGVVAFHESYGKAQVVPVERIMQNDMIFDLTSLTKSLATSIVIMRLVEEGLINLRQKNFYNI